MKETIPRATCGSTPGLESALRQKCSVRGTRCAWKFWIQGRFRGSWEAPGPHGRGEAITLAGEDSHGAQVVLVDSLLFWISVTLALEFTPLLEKSAAF